MKQLRFFGLGIFLSVLASFAVIALTPLTPSYAATNAGFNPELIMSDDIFINKNSMTAAQIQSFLEKQNSVCLKNFTTLSLNDANKDGLGDEPYGKGKNEKVRASTLIYQAAQIYGINPQVILTTLQKEQSLVTRQDCPTKVYNTALGYGCPDTAPCDSSAYGFTRQIDYGVWHFKGFFYDTYPSPPTVPGSKFIAYNPSSSCGGETITIASRATAALYSYTPYQPNPDTLAAAPGQTVPCGAYGNLNFWRFFSGWFGSTVNTPFFRIDNSDEVYIESSDGGYYHIPSPAALISYGYGSAFRAKPRNVSTSYASRLVDRGSLPMVARFEGDQIFAVANGKLYPFTSRSMFDATYGFTMGKEAMLSKSLLLRYKVSSAVNSIMKLNDAAPIYSVENGKKRHITSRTAYETLGSPTVYSERPSTILDSNFSTNIPTGSPILTPASILYSSDTKEWSFWTGSQRYIIDSSLMSSMVFTANYTAPQAVINQLPKASGVISQYTKDGDGKMYILYRNAKYALSAQDAAKLNINGSSLITSPSTFLAKLASKNLHATFIRIEDENRVYKTSGSDMYAVFDPYDLSKFGGSFSNVVSTPSPTRSLYTDNGYLFSTRRLVQVNGNPAVYIVDSKGNMHHVLSREIASQFNIKLVNIAVISSLNNAPTYTRSTNGLTRIIKSTTGTMWLVDSTYRYTLSSEAAKNFLGYSETSSFTVLSDELLSMNPVKRTFSQYGRDASTGKVYKISNGQKHWYESRAAFDKTGVSWSSVVNYSTEFLHSLPSGKSIV